MFLLVIAGHSLANYVFTLVIIEGKCLLSLYNPIDLQFTPIKHRHADILCREQAALLNVLASVCDVLPADSFVHWRKQPGGCSYTMTVRRFFECLAWMLRGFRMVAPDTVAHSYISFGSRKVAAHKRTSCYSYYL